MATIAALSLSVAVFAFSWHQDPEVQLNLFDDGGLNPKIVASDTTGTGYAVWTSNLGVTLASATAGGGWSSGFSAISSGVRAAVSSDISINSSGDYLLVGHFTDILGTYDPLLLADLSVGGVLQNNIEISSNVPGGVGGWPPKTAISENGDALVVWVYPANGQILSRMYRGGSWQTEFVVDASVPDSVDLDVATDSNGNFIVVWSPSAAVETAKIYARRFVSGSWAARELVGQGNGGTNEYPRAGMYDTGKAVVVWQHFEVDGYRIAARIHNGTSWLSQQFVDPDTAGAHSRTPQIAVQNDGKATIAFWQGTSGSSGWGTVYGNTLRSGVWQGPIDISCGNASRNMSVDMDGYGNAAVAYQASGFYIFMGYQDGLGWLGCSRQGWNFQSGMGTLLANQIDKKIALTQHDIFATYWKNPSASLVMYGRRARKDVYINDFDLTTDNRFTDLSITLPFNTVELPGGVICGNLAPYSFQEMRFSNDGSSWSAWEAAPTTDPYTATKTNWDLTASSTGGTSSSGLKRVYIQFRNANCDSIVTHDEILYEPACVPATEICDGIDNDCDGQTDEDDAVDAATWYRDLDGDGYGNLSDPRQACDQPVGYVSDSTDCDDTRAGVNPGAAEVSCDGLNNDCDAGTVDGPDSDGDTYDVCGPGDPANPDGKAADCNDGNAAINPGADELCGDGIDNDCDGNTDDDGVGAPTWYADVDGDSYGDPASTQTACGQPSGYVSDNTDCDDTRTAVNPGASEVCGDGLDNDCDGNTDDDGVGAATWYVDTDIDGYGNPAVSQTACSQPPGYVGNSADCNDGNSAINPGVAEVCGDGIDNNCDGNTDDTGVGAATWYLDADTDGYGTAITSLLACSQPAGYVADGTDCNDANSAINPGVAEVCADSVDNDCNPTTLDIFDEDLDAVFCDVDCDDGDDTIGICNTPGSDGEVLVEESDVAVTYPNVYPPGDTQINRAQCDFAAPDGFVISGQTDCVDVDTTAGFDGEVEICITFNAPGTSCSYVDLLNMLRVDRECSETGNECSTDSDCGATESCNSAFSEPLRVTSRQYTCSGGTTDVFTICAMTPHFSDFAVGELLDTDNDTLEDMIDNCPLTWNFFQLDTDKDGHGDDCDCGATDPNSYPGGPEFCDGVDNDCDLSIDEMCAPACDAPGASGTDGPVSLTTGNAAYPSVVWTGMEYGVAWHDNRDGNWEIYFARLDAMGNKIGADIRVTNDAAISAGPSLVWTGLEYGVAWRDERDAAGEPEIYFCRLDALGNKIGDDIRVTNDAGISSTPSLVWTGREYGVAWRDERDLNSEIYFARLHRRGLKIGTDLRVTSDANASEHVSLVWSGSEYAMVWTDNRHGNQEILFARVDLLGNLIATDVRVTNWTGDSAEPALAWTGSIYGVTWHDDRDGNWEIYFTRLYEDGSRLTTDDLRITNATGNSGYADLEWNGAEFGVVWHDQGAGTYEIYQATIDPYGVVVSGGVALTSDPAGSYAPSAIWTGSEYGIAWHDDRETNMEIYFTRAACCTDADLDGYTACDADCDDGNETVYPGALEVCDYLDNNCDDTIDEGFATPGVTSGLTFAGDKQTISWNGEPLADRYDVVRGELLSLRASGGDFGVASIDCREEDSADSASTVATPPAPGEPYFYLVRSQRDCRHGTFDTGQAGQQGGRDLEIDTSIDRCN